MTATSPNNTPDRPKPWRRRAICLGQAIALGLFAATAIAATAPAYAQNWHYHGNNIRTFTHYDYNAWRHGYWWQGRRSGRYGWWWYASGIWYPYPRPIYPYPNPYVPPVVVQPAPGWAPGPPPPPPATRVWYYCPNPQGYYPYVAQCYGGWQAVPATPQ